MLNDLSTVVNMGRRSLQITRDIDVKPSIELTFMDALHGIPCQPGQCICTFGAPFGAALLLSAGASFSSGDARAAICLPAKPSAPRFCFLLALPLPLLSAGLSSCLRLVFL